MQACRSPCHSTPVAAMPASAPMPAPAPIVAAPVAPAPVAVPAPPAPVVAAPAPVPAPVVVAEKPAAAPIPAAASAGGELGRDKLAEASRDIAIKSFETEVENVRFAVKTVADQFSQAISSVGEYVKTVMMGPQVASQLASNITNLKNDAARTLVSLYQAQNSALEPFIRLSITDAELKSKAEESNMRSQLETAQLRANAALAQIKMVGDAAAASLNGIGAGVSNGMSTSVSM